MSRTSAAVDGESKNVSRLDVYGDDGAYAGSVNVTVTSRLPSSK